ncbi:bifunctional adenosylcobinamide kinase/adenosylcobinamide-phosphate guanylyltransferase [Agarivorans sp. MS3-6]|uniref:bifunctional adenosylcobinamide kinase/adenosylcobinamide-phosphate guanylyltransferase n=1 Tax=Agarivorans sp. TSD2052 TaxID=2937286 RepID=UPI00200F8CB1|nr:bifunctional adenosylcobinamide kinase/adenosylcobinamide-phosphate guanylyltransferase [Agarivorans sp. TSD2052]UPW19774.1 bifunctional adenosylcobinamide kinase/adenosylcobinamide-phosphate guanylyltransferase [Agarivorans sp. TSD2052]
MMITLVLGGIRSGKSRWAEQQFADDLIGSSVYIATSLASDDEMAQRIDHHQRQRNGRFTTHELNFTEECLAEVLAGYAHLQQPILLECMSTWLGWWLSTDKSPQLQLVDIHRQSSLLLEALKQIDSDIVIVSNEVGLGLVSDNAVARMFADELGRLNQALATIADRVVFISAGLPLILKE